MSLQIFGTKKCQFTKKAEMFFKERRLPYHFINIQDKPMSRGELESVVRYVPADQLVDPESKEYKKQQLQYIQYDPLSKILEYPLLLRTPVVRSKAFATCGYDPEGWKRFLN